MHGVKFEGKKKQASKNLLPMLSQRGHLIPPALIYDNTCETFYQGSLLEAQFLLRADYIGTVYLAYTKIQSAKVKQAFHINCTVCRSNLGTTSHSNQREMVRLFLKSKFPDAIQGPAFQTGRSKHGILRPARLTLPPHMYTLWQKYCVGPVKKLLTREGPRPFYPFPFSSLLPEIQM